MPLPFKTQRVLKVEVDEARRAALAAEAAVHNARLRRLEVDADGYKARLKDAREAIEEEVQAIAGKLDIVTAGVEEKKVDCEWREHPDRPFKQLWRLDTGEVIEEKPLDPDEAQRQVPGTEEAAVQAEQQELPEVAAEPEEKRAPLQCPFVYVEGADARQDQLCTEPGVARFQGFCKQHHEQLGGNHSPAKVPLVARRAERVRLWREEQERQAEEFEQADAAGRA